MADQRIAFKRKLVIVGDGTCGKTSLLSVFSNGEFPKEYEPTIFENHVSELRLDNKVVQLALWDTAGQEEYERLRPLSYAKAHVVVIAYSVDNPDSLDNVNIKWSEEARSICGYSIPIILVGLKKDLRDSNTNPNKKCVTYEEGFKMSRFINARHFFECSALLNDGVYPIFEAAARVALSTKLTQTNTEMYGSFDDANADKCCCVIL